MYEYQARYPGTRIKVIEQENRGLAQGRWTGVKNSCGRYITFLDVDEYITQNVTLNSTFNRVVHYQDIGF